MFTTCTYCNELGESGTTCTFCGGRGTHPANKSLWSIEFGDEFDSVIDEHTVEELEGAGFEDDSWHNDAMPSFVYLHADDSFTKIWIDDDERTYSLTRFVMQHYNRDGEPVGKSFHTDRVGRAIDAANGPRWM